MGQQFIGVKEPPDWEKVFGQAGSLELEIGSGMGGFALGYCQKHPNVRYIAFEWRKKYARELGHRAFLRGLSNIRVIEADARYEVSGLFADGSLSAIHLQFPDPWWKRAHQKRAILTPELTRLLFEKTRPGGVFDLRTDVEERARQMLSILETAGFFNPLGRGAFHPRDEEEVPSTRERRYLVSGQPVYRAKLLKL